MGYSSRRGVCNCWGDPVFTERAAHEFLEVHLFGPGRHDTWPLGVLCELP